MTEQATIPLLVAQALQSNKVPRNDIRNLRVKRDGRKSINPWWVICDSIRARCQLALVKCMTQAEACATMDCIQRRLASGMVVVDADEAHVEAVCSLLIDWEPGDILDADV